MSDTNFFRSPLCVAADSCLVRQTKTAVADRSTSVLFIGAFSAPSQGSRGISEDLCARLGSMGWQMRIVSQRPSRVGRLSEMLRTTWHERDRYQVAAIDVYSGPAFYWAKAVCWILRQAGKPYILMLHGGNLPEFASRMPKLVRSLLSSAVAVTTPSAYLMERMKPYRNNIQLLPNAINLANYTFRLPRRGTPRLIWLRAFHEVYNPVMAVRVLADLTRDFPTIHLTMVGPDKGDGSLQKTIQAADSLGVTDNLTIKGAVQKEDVPKMLALGDIFLNTARIDNTPVSVLEAMASGSCVVSTNVGGIPYLVEAEHDALLVPSEDAQSMANAVRRIVAKPDLSCELSCNARRKAERFDWSIILPCWQELFSCALSLDS